MEIIATDKPPTPPPAWWVYRALVGVGVVCALLIVSVFLLTRPSIEENRAEALERAVFAVLPGTRYQRAVVISEAVMHAGYDTEHRLVGVAIEAQGMGYQDRLRLLYGYDPVQQTIIGMRVLESRETPGLGDRIETDKRFIKNFEALDVRLGTESRVLLHPLVAVKQGQKAAPWEIEGITGATVSSKAVARILDNSSERWLPLVQRALPMLTAPGEGDDESR